MYIININFKMYSKIKDCIYTYMYVGSKQEMTLLQILLIAPPKFKFTRISKKYQKIYIYLKVTYSKQFNRYVMLYIKWYTSYTCSQMCHINRIKYSTIFLFYTPIFFRRKFKMTTTYKNQTKFRNLSNRGSTEITSRRLHNDFYLDKRLYSNYENRSY